MGVEPCAGEPPGTQRTQIFEAIRLAIACAPMPPIGMCTPSDPNHSGFRSARALKSASRVFLYMPTPCSSVSFTDCDQLYEGGRWWVTNTTSDAPVSTPSSVGIARD